MDRRPGRPLPGPYSLAAPARRAPAARRAAALALAVLLSWTAAGLGHERKRGRIGFIDRTGRLVFSIPDLHEAGSFSCGLAPARAHAGDELKYGFIDAAEKFRIEPRFDAVSPFSEGLA